MGQRNKFRSSEIFVQANQSQIQAGVQKNKSIYNEETTNITHSQSYFESISPHFNGIEDSNNFSNLLNNVTSCDHSTLKKDSMLKTNQLFSLNEDLQ